MGPLALTCASSWRQTLVSRIRQSHLRCFPGEAKTSQLFDSALSRSLEDEVASPPPQLRSVLLPPSRRSASLSRATACGHVYSLRNLSCDPCTLPHQGVIFDHAIAPPNLETLHLLHYHGLHIVTQRRLFIPESGRRSKASSESAWIHLLCHPPLDRCQLGLECVPTATKIRPAGVKCCFRNPSIS